MSKYIFLDKLVGQPQNLLQGSPKKFSNKQVLQLIQKNTTVNKFYNLVQKKYNSEQIDKHIKENLTISLLFVESTFILATTKQYSLNKCLLRRVN